MLLMFLCKLLSMKVTFILSAAAHETEKGKLQATDNTEQKKYIYIRVIGMIKLCSSYKAWCFRGKICGAFHGLRVSLLINYSKSCKYNLAAPLACASKWIGCPLQKTVGNNDRYSVDGVPIIWCARSVSQHFFCNGFIYTLFPKLSWFEK